MDNIEKKINLRQKILSIIEKKMIEGGYRDKYGKLELLNIGKNIYALKSLRTLNIQGFYNEKGDVIFSIYGLIEDFGKGKTDKEKFESGKKVVDKYLEKLGYKWYKDQNGYYHMINIKTGKEIPQISIEYYEIFKQLAFVDDRQRIVSTLNAEDMKVFMEKGRSLYESIADILEDLNKEGRLFFETIQTTQSISPLEYFSYLNLGLVEKQDILRYTEQVFNLDYFEKYYNNEGFKLLEDKKFKILLGEGKVKYDGERILFEKYKAYEISLKPSVENIDLILEKVLPFVEKLELTNTKNKEEQEKTKQRYEELREFLKKEKEKLEEKSKSRKKFASLEDDVKDKLV